MVELAMSDAGWRRCRHCSVPFQPPQDLAEIAAQAIGLKSESAWLFRERPLEGATTPEFTSLAAWVEGFCARECLHAHALNVIATRSAWWLKQPTPNAAALRHIEQRSLLIREQDDAPRPGELCSCGRPAVTVYITEEFGRVGYCGIPDGGQQPREGTA